MVVSKFGISFFRGSLFSDTKICYFPGRVFVLKIRQLGTKGALESILVLSWRTLMHQHSMQIWKVRVENTPFFTVRVKQIWFNKIIHITKLDSKVDKMKISDWTMQLFPNWFQVEFLVGSFFWQFYKKIWRLRNWKKNMNKFWQFYKKIGDWMNLKEKKLQLSFFRALRCGLSADEDLRGFLFPPKKRRSKSHEICESLWSGVLFGVFAPRLVLGWRLGGFGCLG